jgi:hypothetical protein
MGMIRSVVHSRGARGQAPRLRVLSVCEFATSLFSGRTHSIRLSRQEVKVLAQCYFPTSDLLCSYRLPLLRECLEPQLVFDLARQLVWR